ncbi:hypothetical protein HZ994_06265 [Akkermansiaceae bacterium]|nr:hypothetical protein HZ994_06265 [Akkermansiaceae bacterium]
MKLTSILLSSLLCTACLSAETILDAGGDGATKTEVSDSMIGFRDTLRFYEFAQQHAILLVRIDNRDTKFAISAKLFLFAEGTTAEDMGKWVNNQHSDGLFADAPDPKASHEIPAASCKVLEHAAADLVEAPNGKFTNYTVTFAIKDVPPIGDIRIKDFTDKASVKVKSVEG